MYFDSNLIKLRCTGCFQPRKLYKNNLCFECISCTGKESFTSISAAKASARWRDGTQFSTFSRRDSQYLKPYICNFCKHYHLGHAQFTKQIIQKGEIYG